MLLQFSVENFLSFKEKVVLDLRANATYKEHPWNVISGENSRDGLRVSTIYGASASGKSNVIKAFGVAKKIVTESLSVAIGNEDILQQSYMPYLFHLSHQDAPVSFEWVFLIDGEELTYGFSFHQTEIIKEWLHRKKQASPRPLLVFEREGRDIQFGHRLSRTIKSYGSTVPKKTLLLTFFGKVLQSEVLFNHLFCAIKNSYTTEKSPFSESIYYNKLQQLIDTDKESLVQFLRVIEPRIQDADYETTGKTTQFYIGYLDDTERHVKLPLRYESEAMKRMIELFVFAKEVIQNGHVMFVDALDTVLSKRHMQYFINLFYQEQAAAQLIYTTHNTALLDAQYFRRDQVWFVEKTAQGQSTLYSLGAFNLEADTSLQTEWFAKICGA